MKRYTIPKKYRNVVKQAYLAQEAETAEIERQERKEKEIELFDAILEMAENATD